MISRCSRSMRSFRNSWASCWLQPEYGRLTPPVHRHQPLPRHRSPFLPEEQLKVQNGATRAPDWPYPTPPEKSHILQLSHLYPEKEGTYFWKTARNRVGLTASHESGCHRAPITSAKAIRVGVGRETKVSDRTDKQETQEVGNTRTAGTGGDNCQRLGLGAPAWAFGSARG